VRAPARDNPPMSEQPERLADGLWRWTARHPEWHPGEFGKEVASFALEPLLERDIDRVLVTHGQPVLQGGRDARAAALAAPPIDPR